MACARSLTGYKPFFNTGAGLNPTERLALMFMTAPVCGLRPLRALRERTVKVPKPGTWNRLLFLIALPMWSNVASTATVAVTLVIFALFATASTHSALVMA